MAPQHWDRHAASYTTPRDVNLSFDGTSRTIDWRSCDIATGYEFDGRAVGATLALVEAHLSQSCGCRVPPQFLDRRVEDATVHCVCGPAAGPWDAVDLGELGGPVPKRSPAP